MANRDLLTFFEGAGLFLYPLVLCSLLAVGVIIERLLALRKRQILPFDLQAGVMAGNAVRLSPDYTSAAGRIILFHRDQRPEPETLKAYAMLEIIRLERGLFVLDIVVGAAPLLGLLGTVAGLVRVFSGIDPASGLPDALEFVGGIAMALSTTLIGLSIALPALVGSGFLHRRAETLGASLNVVVERLLEAQDHPPSTESAAG